MFTRKTKEIEREHESVDFKKVILEIRTTLILREINQKMKKQISKYQLSKEKNKDGQSEN